MLKKEGHPWPRDT